MFDIRFRRLFLFEKNLLDPGAYIVIHGQMKLLHLIRFRFRHAHGHAADARKRAFVFPRQRYRFKTESVRGFCGKHRVF